MVYRIFTEDIMRDTVESIMVEFFDGFTIYNATGYWQGAKENSIIIEIVGEQEIENIVQEAGSRIKHALRQEAVLITAIPEAKTCLV